MARIPVLAGPGQLQSPGTVAPANLPAVTNQAIGQGLQTASQEFSRVEQMARRANDVKNLTDASVAMSQAQVDFAKYQQENPDESKWLEKWNETVGSVQTSIGEMPLTPDARAQLTDRFSSWSTRGTINVQAEAFRQAGRNAALAVDNAITLADQTGDYSQAYQAVDDYTSKIPVSPEEKEALRLQVQTREREWERGQDKMIAETILRDKGGAGVAEANAVFENSPHWTDKEKKFRTSGNEYAAEVEHLKVIANDDPIKALELAPLKLRGPERIMIEKTAGNRIQELKAESIRMIDERIKAGFVPTKDELEGNPYLSPPERVEIMEFALRGPVNDPVGYATIYADAANFQGEEGSPEYAVMTQRINMALDGDLKSKTLSKLGESAKNKDPDALTRSLNEVYSLAKDDLAAGRYGELYAPISSLDTELPAKARAEVDIIKKSLLTDEEKERIAKEPTRIEYIERKARDLWVQQQPGEKKFEEFVIENEKAKTLANRRYQDSLMALEKWKTDNPKATPAELRAQYDRITVRYRASSNTPGTAPNPLLPSLNASPVDLNALINQYANP